MKRRELGVDIDYSDEEWTLIYLRPVPYPNDPYYLAVCEIGHDIAHLLVGVHNISAWGVNHKGGKACGEAVRQRVSGVR